MVWNTIKMDYDKAVAICTLFSTSLSVILLLIITFISNAQSNIAQDTVSNLAATTMISELPGQSCNIPDVTNLINGSYCQPLSTGCDVGAPTDYDFVNYTNAMPMWNALINCNVVSIIDVHDQTNFIDKQKASSDILSKFYKQYSIDGQPSIYSKITLNSKGRNFHPILLDNVVARISSTDGYNFVWLNITQNANTSQCLNKLFTLNISTNYNCALNNWYVTVPYCRYYSCTNGIYNRYYSTYSYYINIVSNNFKGKLYGISISLSNINAIYGGIIGALVALIGGFIITFHLFILAFYKNNAYFSPDKR